VRVIAKKLRRDEGQALVELAFVIPILLLFLFGIIDFGLALNTSNADTNTANLAAREASVIGTAVSAPCVIGTTTTSYTTIQGWAQCEEQGDGSSGTPNVCVYDVNDGIPTSSSTQQNWTVGDSIKVEVSTVFNWSHILTGNDLYVNKVVSPTTTINSSAELRLEDSVNGTSTSGTSTFLSPSCTS
jgi:Flp pilus assembly protein TadG